jgi:NTP pyrophosphatase (non-canonical NTP hydrolase)
MSELKKMQASILEFRKARDWKQFHNPKDCAISLSLEAAEVLEHFQWKTLEETGAYIKSNKSEISHELADVLYWVLLLAADMKIDIKKAFYEKMAMNQSKYPIAKAKGSHKKYTEL